MKDILCPKCQKDEYDIIEVNGVKVKQCKICSAIYQLAEDEIGPFYLLDSKDINGDFVKCPRCGSTIFSKTIDLKYRADYIWIHYFLSRGRGAYLSPREYEYMCLNKNCYFLWNSTLDLMRGR